MNVVAIREEPIELYKLLKLANMAASGGEAKMFIGEGLVKVNGVVETRKRKKIVGGDIIDLDGEQVQVSLPENTAK
ncbi:MAG: RNA-binding S4 domain-containing protein [Desulfobulbaceae bacterium]|nr:RNA-binding S4 domain-containing protein [Desulfobulbaceae bacterium]